MALYSGRNSVQKLRLSTNLGMLLQSAVPARETAQNLVRTDGRKWKYWPTSNLKTTYLLATNRAFLNLLYHFTDSVRIVAEQLLR